MTKLEEYVEKYLVRKAKALGFIYYKLKALSIAGVPDRLLVANGYTIFIELKAPKKKPRPLQWARIHELQNQGADVFVIDNRQDIDILLDYIVKHPLKNRHFKNLPHIGVKERKGNNDAL